MPPIQSLVSAQMQSAPDSKCSGLDRAELEARLEELHRRLTLFDATERVARIGHYEWSREKRPARNLFGRIRRPVRHERRRSAWTRKLPSKKLSSKSTPTIAKHYMYVRPARCMTVKELDVEFRILLQGR